MNIHLFSTGLYAVALLYFAYLAYGYGIYEAQKGREIYLGPIKKIKQLGVPYLETIFIFACHTYIIIVCALDFDYIHNEIIVPYYKDSTDLFYFMQVFIYVYVMFVIYKMYSNKYTFIDTIKSDERINDLYNENLRQSYLGISTLPIYIRVFGFVHFANTYSFHSAILEYHGFQEILNLML